MARLGDPSAPSRCLSCLTRVLPASLARRLTTIAAADATARAENERATRYYWRGMRGLRTGVGFHEMGGCELGVMSTTEDLSIALRYALGDAIGTDGVASTALLLRLNVRNFKHDGVDIAFLSFFPHEHEFLYPPLTLLEQPTSVASVVYGATTYVIIDVAPQYPEM